MRGLVQLALLVSSLALFEAQAGGSPHIPIPEGYELQMLEPIQGEVARPKGWVYTGSCSEYGCRWIVSKERKADGSYLTGLAVQMFLGVDAAGVGKTKLIEETIADRRKTAQVLDECAPHADGDFTVYCLETLETSDHDGSPVAFHVRYTLQAHNTMDMVVVQVFGAPAGEWDEAEPIAEVMSNILLISPDFHP